ncbi:RING-H2 finger protein ATL65-like [Phragmites australis]|uniref:RING-H2 finger protein ATL65-like n=1 Tax=Phragmites australis TaxID=29695 RepID=UPI002D7997EC|nr:RING-H2 finger protein ATL65-like [Phragmites australis]
MPPSPSPAPAPAPSVASLSGVISSPPSPCAVASPGPAPAPEPSAAAVVRAVADGRRGGGSLSPPLIAMLAVVGAALMVVLYARLVNRVFRAARRRWRRRRRLRLLMIPGSPSAGGGDSFASFTTYDNYYHTFSPYYGLDDAAIKSLPSAQFLAAAAAARGSGAARDCAVCLLEFADGDELRALPLCGHAFHADCIDVWLRAHASCPLCRAAVALPPPVASPLRAARRVRPSLDDLLFFHPVPPPPPDGAGALPEIAPASPDQLSPRDFLLKRSYSFGFERSLAVEAASTASPPWRYRVSAADGAASRSRSLWSKRWPSPFGGGGGSAAARVFSFRSYRSAAAKSSPFSRRRGPGGGSGFFMSLASEPPSILAAARRSRATAASSRLRCGDPEALLSPDRLSR